MRRHLIARWRDFWRGGVEPSETSEHFLSVVGSSVRLLLKSAFSNFVIHLQTFALAPNTILVVDVCGVGCFIACCCLD